MKKILICILFLSLANLTLAENIHHPRERAIKQGIRFLASVQKEYGEFPTTFYPNLPEPQNMLYANYDSNMFTSAMIADAIHELPGKHVKAITDRVAKYLLTQLNNERGLWSYFTTHNPHPLYPNTIYDLDDTALASIVLQQNRLTFPNNVATIQENRAPNGAYLTFIDKPIDHNDVDCGVNANVLSYLQDNDPAACSYLNSVITRGENCASYYSKLDAYYLMSRAYHSGVTCLENAREAMQGYVLSQFNNNGNVDNNVFETAVAVNALLDVNYTGKEVRSGIHYLLQTQSKLTGGWQAKPFWLWTLRDGTVMGRSGSEAMTTAIALKAIHRSINLY